MLRREQPFDGWIKMRNVSAISGFALAATLGGLDLQLRPVDSNDAEAVAKEAERVRTEESRRFDSPTICTTAEAMERTGTTSPRQALLKMRKDRGTKRIVYLPHIGAKQRAKAEKRRLAALKKSVGL